jgi:hypothetical protein
MLLWAHQLLLRRTHSWAHRDGVGPGIVEGEPRQGAPTVVATVSARAGVLVFLLSLDLTLAFVLVVGGRRGRGRLRTRRFLPIRGDGVGKP